jgi:hypothetical protein
MWQRVCPHVSPSLLIPLTALSKLQDVSKDPKKFTQFVWLLLFWHIAIVTVLALGMAFTEWGRKKLRKYWKLSRKPPTPSIRPLRPPPPPPLPRKEDLRTDRNTQQETDLDARTLARTNAMCRTN